MGAEAVLALLDAKPSTPACVIALDGNQIVRVPLMQAVEMVRARVSFISVYAYKSGARALLIPE